MILTSPSEVPGQKPPVTTTFDPPTGSRRAAASHRRRASKPDWGRVERLHAFVRARAVERLDEAEQSGDVARREHRKSIHAIDAMFTQAQSGHRVVVECAITFLRARAMRDAHHPEFLGEWLGAPAEASRSA